MCTKVRVCSAVDAVCTGAVAVGVGVCEVLRGEIRFMHFPNVFDHNIFLNRESWKTSSTHIIR